MLSNIYDNEIQSQLILLEIWKIKRVGRERECLKYSQLYFHTEPLSGDYEITSFGSTVISDAVTYRKENRIIALNKDFGVDGDVGTCAQSRNTDLSEAYFRVGFEEEFFIHTVDLYQIFYNTWPGKKDWHYGDCWLNSTKLEVRLFYSSNSCKRKCYC